MKKYRILTSAIVIITIATTGVVMGKQRFGQGTIYCFSSDQTVEPLESCTIQNYFVQVDYQPCDFGTTTNPCGAAFVPYWQSGPAECTALPDDQEYCATLP